MVTVFDVIAAAAGAWLGSTAGSAVFGHPGVLAGGVLGVLLSPALARMLLALALRLLDRNFKRSSTEKLRARLWRDYHVAHLIIAELLARGERVESLAEYVNALMTSQEPLRQARAQALLKIWPEILPTPPDEPAATAPSAIAKETE